MEQVEVKDHERVVVLKQRPGNGFQVGDIRVYTQFGNASTTLFIVAPKDLEIKRIKGDRWNDQNG